MTRRQQKRTDGWRAGENARISRRLALGSSGLAVLGMLSGPAWGRSEDKGPGTQLPKEIQERIEKSKAFGERIRSAESTEERMKIMEEQRAWQRTRAVDDLKSQLGISDEEWRVLRPRLQALYNLVHPLSPMGPGGGPPKTEVEQRSRELRELLQEEKAPADQIKTKLTALRAAKEKAAQELSQARQGLRQLMTLRQEAVLVLNGLLD
ncbi:MAG: hypothetical protein FJ280_07855 [Planctomycetes bacterium]|nr:hypothetical protein [Planctomycetota bacterium]